MSGNTKLPHNTKSPYSQDKQIIFSNINKRAQSAGPTRPNPRDIVIDQINQNDKSNVYLSSTEYKNQLYNLQKHLESDKNSSGKKSNAASRFEPSPKKQLPLKGNLKIRTVNDDESMNTNKVYDSNVSSKQTKKVTIIAEPLKSKSSDKNKIQELDSDSDDDSDDEIDSDENIDNE